jgi:hypothetical protein
VKEEDGEEDGVTTPRSSDLRQTRKRRRERVPFIMKDGTCSQIYYPTFSPKVQCRPTVRDVLLACWRVVTTVTEVSQNRKFIIERNFLLIF